MEEWQKNHIVSNLVELVESTEYSRNAIIKLQQEKKFATSELDKLDATFNNDGKSQACFQFYELVQKKAKSYDILVESLFLSNQIKAGSILLDGYKTIPPFNLLKKPFADDNGNPLFSIFADYVIVQGKSVQVLQLIQQLNTKPYTSFINKVDDVTRTQISTNGCTLVLSKYPDPFEDYIVRAFRQRFYLKQNVLTEPSEIFLIGGMTEETLGDMVKPQKTYKVDTFIRNQQHVKLLKPRFFLDTRQGDFQNACKLFNDSQNIHRLVWRNDRFEWKRSHGKLLALMKYVEAAEELLNEQQFIDHVTASSTKNVILCGTAGMGKSIVMQQLAYLLKSSKFTMVFFFEFDAFLRLLLKNPENEINELAIIEVITNEYSDTTFGKAVLRNALENENNSFAILLDGYDELLEANMHYAELLFNVIRTRLYQFHLIVSTRPHLCEKLEQLLGVFASVITPLTKDQQVSLLVNTWMKEKIKNVDDHDKSSWERTKDSFRQKIEEFAQKRIQDLVPSGNEDTGINAGEPLQCTFLGEISFSSADKFTETNKAPDEDSITTKYDIYQKLVQKRQERLKVETKGISRRQIETVHTLAAVELLFPHRLEQFLNLLDMEKSIYMELLKHNDVARIGLFSKRATDTDPVNFVHRLIAEYLLANFITHELFSKERHESTENKEYIQCLAEFFMKDVLSTDGGAYQTILPFPIDRFFTIKIYGFYHLDLSNFINQELNTWNPEDLNDAFNSIGQYFYAHMPHDPETIISACSKDGLSGLVELILQMTKISGRCLTLTSQVFVGAAKFSGELHNDYMYKIIQNDSAKVVEEDVSITPLEAAAQRGDLVIFNTVMQYEKYLVYGRNLLHLCMRGSANDNEHVLLDKIKIIDQICTFVADFGNVSYKLMDGSSPFLQADTNITLLEHLLTKGADINEVNKNCESVLHIYLQSTRLGKIKSNELNTFLTWLQKNNFNFRPNNTASNTSTSTTNKTLSPVWLAIEKAEFNTDTLDIFRDSNCNMREENIHGESIAYAAIRYNQDVQLLRKIVLENILPQPFEGIKNHAHENLLHVAVKCQNIEALRCILELAGETVPKIVTAKDAKGNTPLHYSFEATSAVGLQIQDELLQRRSDLLDFNNDSLTPLEYGLTVRNYACINVKRLKDFENNYKIDLKHFAMKLLQILNNQQLIAAETESLNEEIKAFSDLREYLWKKAEENINFVFLPNLIVHYNGTEQKLKEIFSDDDFKSLLQNISDTNIQLLLETFDLQSAEYGEYNLRLLKKNIPMIPANYRRRMFKVIGDSDETCSEEQLPVSTKDLKLLLIRSTSIGLSTVLWSLSLRLQAANPLRIVVFVNDINMLVGGQFKEESLLDKICNNVAASNLSNKILRQMMLKGMVDIVVDGVAMNTDVCTELYDEIQNHNTTLSSTRLIVACREYPDIIFVEVQPFTNEDLISFLSTIWASRSTNLQYSDALVHAHQYLQEIQYTLNIERDAISDHILGLTLLSDDSEVPLIHGNVLKDLHEYIFTAYEHLALEKHNDDNLQNRAESQLLQYSSNRKQFLNCLNNDYRRAQLINEVMQNPKFAQKHSDYETSTMKQDFKTYQTTPIGKSNDLGVYPDGLQIDCGEIQTYTFSQKMMITFLEGLLPSTLGSPSYSTIRFIEGNTPEEFYQVVVSCVINRSDKLLGCFLQAFNEINQDAYVAYFGERWYHLLLLASKYSSTSTIQELSSKFVSFAEFSVFENLTSTLTPLHVAVEVGNITAVESIKQLFVPELLGRKYLHTLLFNTTHSTTTMISQRLKIMNYFLISEPALLTNENDCRSALQLDSVHVDLLTSLISKLSEEMLEKLSFEDKLFHRAACCMPPVQFERFLQYLQSDEKLSYMIRLINDETPLYAALKNGTSITLKAAEILVGKYECELYSYLRIGRKSLLFLDLINHSAELRNYIINTGIQYFLKSDEICIFLDAVTEAGDDHIVSLLWNLNHLELDAGKRHKNNLLHLSAIYQSPEEFHCNILKTITEGRTEMLSSINHEGLTPLHLAIKNMEVCVKTIDLLQVSGLNISGFIQSNRGASKIAKLYKRSESLTAALKQAETENEISYPEKPCQSLPPKRTLIEELLSQYIDQIQTKLLEETKTSKEIVEYFTKKEYIKSSILEDIESAQQAEDKLKILYDFLKEKPKLYGHFIKGFGHLKILRAVDLLSRGLPIDRVFQLKIDLNGTITSLTDLLGGFDEDDWIQIRDKLTFDELEEVANICFSEESTKRITIRPGASVLKYYIPRSLHEFALITDPSQFFATDIGIVILGISPIEVENYPYIKNPKLSSNQMDGLNTKHIILEDITHWDILFKLFHTPMYLVEYNSTLKTFTLEDTRHVDGQLAKCMTQIGLPCFPVSPTKLTEKEMVKIIESGHTGSKVICLVDLPGSGKSSCFESLASQVSDNDPGKLVASIYLPDLCTERSSWTEFDFSDKLSVRELLVQYITKSKLKSMLLIRILDEGKLSFYLFLDGLDDVIPTHQDAFCKLVKTAATLEQFNTIFNTSPNLFLKNFMDSQYDLYSFVSLTTAEEIELFRRYTLYADADIDTHGISMYQSAIPNYLYTLKANDANRALGVPILLRVASKSFSNKYLRKQSVDSEFLGQTISAAYSQFVGMSLSRTQTDTVRNLANTLNTIESLIGKPSKDPSEDPINELIQKKRLYVWNALALLFPNLADIYMKNFGVNEQNNFPWSIDPKRKYEGQLTFTMIHQTIAEFLVSKFFKDMLLDKVCAPQEWSIFKFQTNTTIFEQVLSKITTGKHFKIWSPDMKNCIKVPKLTFKHPILVFLLNDNMSLKRNVFQVTWNLRKILSPKNMCALLAALITHNYLNLFNAVSDMFKNTKVFPRSKLRTHLLRVDDENVGGNFNAVSLVCLTCMFSNDAMFVSLSTVLSDYFSINLSELFTSVAITYPQSVSLAIANGSAGIVEKLLDLEQEPVLSAEYLRNCIEATHKDNQQIILGKIRILEVLKSKYDRIFLRYWEQLASYRKVHLDIIKVLIRLGAYKTSPEYAPADIIEKATLYMSVDMHNELIDFMLHPENLKNIITNPSKFSLIKVLSMCHTLGLQRFEKFLNIDGTNLMETDEEGNNLLMCSVRYKKPFEFFDLLVQKKIPLDAVNHKGNNVLHLATYYSDEQVVRFLISKKFSVDEIDKDKKSCIHFASRSFEMFMCIVGYGGKIRALDRNKNTVVHLAAIEMNEEDFSRFITEVLKYDFASDILNSKNRNLRTPLHERFHSEFKLDIETVTRILNCKGVSQNSCDENGYNYYTVAKQISYNSEFLNSLVNLGVPNPEVESETSQP